MNERNQPPPCAPTGLFIDQLGAPCPPGGELALDVGHQVGEMVQTGTSPVEEASHRRIRSAAAEQLKARGTNIKEHGDDAVLRDLLTMARGHAQQPPVEVHRGVEISDGDADVVDRGRAKIRRHCSIMTR